VTLDEGPLRRAVLRVGLPATAFQLLVFANNFVDYFWVQRLGEEAAAGQTQGWTVFWMIASLGQIFSTGTTSVVARRVGERRLDAAAHAATHAARGALAAAVLVGALGWLLVPLVVAANRASPAAAGYTLDYLNTLCAGAPLIFLFYAVEGTFKGHGDMHRPLRALATAVVLNMVLDPLLIFGLGLAVTGAALATVIAFGVTGLLLGREAHRRRWIQGPGASLDLAIVRRVLAIGTPVSVHGILFSGVYVFIVAETNLAAGDAATAALGLGLRIEGVAYMTGVGFAAAAASVVGQCLGAGRPRRANEGAWTATRWAVWLTGGWGLVLFLLPAGLVALVAPSAEATAYTLLYCRIVAISVPFTALEMVLEGAFSGAGDTRPALFLALPLTLLRIPLAMLLTRVLGWGAEGVFWALTWTSVARGILLAFWWARGRWVLAKA